MYGCGSLWAHFSSTCLSTPDFSPKEIAPFVESNWEVLWGYPRARVGRNWWSTVGTQLVSLFFLSLSPSIYLSIYLSIFIYKYIYYFHAIISIYLCWCCLSIFPITTAFPYSFSFPYISPSQMLAPSHVYVHRSMMNVFSNLSPASSGARTRCMPSSTL